ncbi:MULTISPECIES: hypothetical protein [unclassified Rhodococcus (in: high G+C Gram-positive bacteria)]|nr:hypothetical protein [Rhodococcus sp. DK17]
MLPTLGRAPLRCGNSPAQGRQHFRGARELPSLLDVPVVEQADECG